MIRLSFYYANELTISVRLSYPIATQRSCLFLCDQAILQLLRQVAYFCAIRLPYSYLERLPISVRLGYHKATQRGCLFLCDYSFLQLLREVAYFCAIRPSSRYLERLPISVRLGYPIATQRRLLVSVRNIYIRIAIANHLLFVPIQHTLLRSCPARVLFAAHQSWSTLPIAR